MSSLNPDRMKHRYTLLFISTSFLATIMCAQPGALDPLFGTGGWLGLDGGGTLIAETAYDMEIQPDGKIVMIGYFADQQVVVRYMPDGSLDPSFGIGGIVDTNVAVDWQVWNIALQPDGKILITSSIVDGLQSKLAVVRYLTDGSLDITFGGDGVAEATIGAETSEGYDVAVHSDGKIVVAGRSVESVYFSATTVRFMPDGSLDNSFSGDGIIQWTANGDETVRSVAIQPDGKVLVAGALFNPLFYDAFILRYNVDGTPDNTFGTAGSVIMDLGGTVDEFTRILLRPGGKILLTGNTGSSAPFRLPIAVQLNSDGTPDLAFGTNGVTSVLMSADAICFGSLLQSTGEVVMTATVFATDNVEPALIRLTAAGQLDATFGTGGIAWGPTAPEEYHYNMVKQLAGGQFMVCGALVYSSNNSDILLARHLSSGMAAIEEQNTSDGDLALWPVPAGDILHIAIGDGPASGFSIELRDATGRSIPTTPTIAGLEMTLNVAELPPGVYCITSRHGTHSITQRFIKD